MTREYDGPATAILNDGTRITGHFTAEEFQSGSMKEWEGRFEVDSAGDASELFNEDGFVLETETGQATVYARTNEDTSVVLKGGVPPWKGKP